MASELRPTERTLDPTACSYPAAPSSSSGLFMDGEANPMKASTCVSPETTSVKQSAETHRWRWQVSVARLFLRVCACLRIEENLLYILNIINVKLNSPKTFDKENGAKKLSNFWLKTLKSSFDYFIL